jgi:hypothetical protein
MPPLSETKFHNINNMQFQRHSAPVPLSTLKASHQILGASNQSATAAAALVSGICNADPSQPMRVLYRNEGEVIFAEWGGSATSRDQDSKSRRASPRMASVTLCSVLLSILLCLQHVGLAAMVLVPLLFELFGEFSFRKSPEQSPSVVFALGPSQTQTSCDTRTLLLPMLTNGPV